MFNYLSFGYIPTGHFWADLAGRLRGAPNLLKRLQAKRLMEVLSPLAGERLLDFGCGSGFFTYEAARAGAAATGVDIVRLPPGPFTVGAGTATFRTVAPSGPLPFATGEFAKILLSEVFVVLENPEQVARELYRVLKAGGRIYVVNTLGRLQIEQAYRRNALLIRLAKALWKRCPETYAAFCRRFFEADRLGGRRWLTADELEGFLKAAGFVSVRRAFPFAALGPEIVYWTQFFGLCATNRLTVGFGLLRYLFLEALNRFSRSNDHSAILITGEKA